MAAGLHLPDRRKFLHSASGTRSAKPSMAAITLSYGLFARSRLEAERYSRFELCSAAQTSHSTSMRVGPHITILLMNWQRSGSLSRRFGSRSSKRLTAILMSNRASGAPIQK